WGTYMYSPRDQFLSGTALAIDEDGALCRSYGANRLFQFLHGGADTDDVIQGVARRGIALKSKILPAEGDFFEDAADGQLDLPDHPWRLANVVGSAAGFHRLDRGFIIIHCRNQDDCGIRRDLVGMTQDLDAIDIWHLDIGNDHVEQRGVELFLCRFAGV